MKKILCLIVLSVLFLYTDAQVIPNNSFENWTGGKPDSWDASNENILGNNIITVIQDTSSIDGSYAPRIKTTEITILTNTIGFPGLITLGEFSVNLTGGGPKVEGGIAFAAKPDSMTGYFVSSPKTGDSCMVVIGFVKYDSLTGRDTIGYGYQFFPSIVSGWTPFTMPINWSSPDNPDSMNIIISSSDLYNMTLVKNSTFWIDKLSFVYNSTSIIDIDFDNNISVYPDVSGNQIIIHFNDIPDRRTNFRIFNISGQLVYDNIKMMNVNDHHINIGNYRNGTYIIEVATDANEKFTQKIMIH